MRLIPFVIIGLRNRRAFVNGDGDAVTGMVILTPEFGESSLGKLDNHHQHPHFIDNGKASRETEMIVMDDQKSSSTTMLVVPVIVVRPRVRWRWIDKVAIVSASGSLPPPFLLFSIHTRQEFRRACLLH